MAHILQTIFPNAFSSMQPFGFCSNFIDFCSGNGLTMNKYMLPEPMARSHIEGKTVIFIGK